MSWSYVFSLSFNRNSIEWNYFHFFPSKTKFILFTFSLYLVLLVLLNINHFTSDKIYYNYLLIDNKIKNTAFLILQIKIFLKTNIQNVKKCRFWNDLFFFHIFFMFYTLQKWSLKLKFSKRKHSSKLLSLKLCL